MGGRRPDGRPHRDQNVTVATTRTEKTYLQHLALLRNQSVSEMCHEVLFTGVRELAKQGRLYPTSEKAKP